MEVQIRKADTLEVHAEALLYPGTTLGTMDDPQGERILALTGDALRDETVDTAPIAVGASTVNPVTGLNVSWMIYSPVVKDPGDRITVENVRRCTRATLVACCIRGFESVVLPAIHPTSEEMSMAETARAMVDELRGFRTDHDFTVHLVHDNQRVVDALQRTLDTVR